MAHAHNAHELLLDVDLVDGLPVDPPRPLAAQAVKRGDIFWADIVPRSGSEQPGRRPVVVVSHDGFNRVEAWRSIIVVPLSSSTAQRRGGPTAVVLPKGTGGLRQESVALCHQVTTLDRAKLV